MCVHPETSLKILFRAMTSQQKNEMFFFLSVNKNSAPMLKYFGYAGWIFLNQIHIQWNFLDMTIMIKYGDRITVREFFSTTVAQFNNVNKYECARSKTIIDTKQY